MDVSSVTLAAVVIVPAFLLVILRVNASLVYLSLCLGEVLVLFVARDTVTYIALHGDKLPSQASNLGDSTIKLALLIAPALLTSIFMIKSVHGPTKRLLNILPAVATGILLALLAVPLLQPGTSHNIINSTIWKQIVTKEDILIGASSAVCLIGLWLMRSKTGSHSKHAKHAK
jgi:hypothetical protein